MNDSKKQRLYSDMDNVLVDFKSGIDRLDEATRITKYLDDVLHKRLILSHHKDLIKGDYPY